MQTRMGRNDLKKHLMDAYEEKVGAFVSSYEKAQQELGERLAELYAMFGQRVVESSLALSHIPLKDGVFGGPIKSLALTKKGVSAKTTGAQPGGIPSTTDTAPPESLRKLGVFRKRRRRRGMISFSEAIDAVIGVLKEWSANQTAQQKRFTTSNVRTWLDEKRVKYDPQRLTVILSSYINGVAVVGKQKKSQRVDVNVYEIQGALSRKQTVREVPVSPTES